MHPDELKISLLTGDDVISWDFVERFNTMSHEEILESLELVKEEIKQNGLDSYMAKLQNTKAYDYFENPINQFLGGDASISFESFSESDLREWIANFAEIISNQRKKFEKSRDGGMSHFLGNIMGGVWK